VFSTFLKTFGVFVSTVLGDVDSIGLEPHHPVSTRTNQSGHKRPMHFRESPAAYAHDTSGRSTKEEEHDIAEVHKAHVKNSQMLSLLSIILRIQPAFESSTKTLVIGFSSS